MAQCGLSRTVGTHEHMNLAIANGEVEPFQNFLALDTGMQIFYFEHIVIISFSDE